MVAPHFSASKRRDGRVAEGARLESVYRGNSIQGSNPCLSASSSRSVRLKTHVSSSSYTSPYNSMRVLVIDDDVCIHDLVTLAMSTRGWEVVTALSGEEGIQTALASKPDVILLDVHMPPASGPAILAELRSHDGLRDVPIVWLTAESIEAKNLESGVRGAISKPFDPRRLAQQIEDLLNR